MIAQARLAAYDVLRAVNSGRSDLPLRWPTFARGSPTNAIARSPAEIATGTLRWQGAFDAIIEAFTNRARFRSWMPRCSTSCE